MHCFNHTSQNAIGMCPACNRAICHQCLHPDFLNVCCHNKECFETAKTIKSLIAQSSKIHSATCNRLKLGNVEVVGTSILFLIMGGLFLLADDMSFGITFLVFGLFCLGLGLKSILSKKLKYPKL